MINEGVETTIGYTDGSGNLDSQNKCIGQFVDQVHNLMLLWQKDQSIDLTNCPISATIKQGYYPSLSFSGSNNIMFEGRRNFNNLSPQERHRRLISCHISQQNNNQTSNSMNDDCGFFSPQEEEEIRQQHRYWALDVCSGNNGSRLVFRFIRPDGEQVTGFDKWATRLAKRYYKRLFKEYCIVDLSLYVHHTNLCLWFVLFRYEYGCLGTRWRTENEVKDGKGQFTCASTQCNSKESLGTYEINFSYSEDGVKKQALVKVRLCPECTRKMNYKRTVLKEKVGAVLRKDTRKRGKDHLKPKDRVAKKKKITKKKTKRTVDANGEDVRTEDGLRDEQSSSDECLDDLFL